MSFVCNGFKYDKGHCVTGYASLVILDNCMRGWEILLAICDGSTDVCHVPGLGCVYLAEKKCKK